MYYYYLFYIGKIKKQCFHQIHYNVKLHTSTIFVRPFIVCECFNISEYVLVLLDIVWYANLEMILHDLFNKLLYII